MAKNTSKTAIIRSAVILSAVIIIAFLGAKKLFPPADYSQKGVTLPLSMKLSSPAFNANAPIPSQYTCTGENVSPPLQLNEAPEGTKSFAVLVDDPDAPLGTFTHWVEFNIPAETRQVPEKAEGIGVPGKNTFGGLGYSGPCPPFGTHRYIFTLFALDTMLDLPKGSGKDQVWKAMQGHILDQAELLGTYQKP